MQDKDDALAMVNKLDKLGKSKEALKYCNIAIGLDPDFVLAHMYKADMLRKLGRNKEALACLDKLVDSKEEEYMVWIFYKRAYLLYELGKGNEAIANLNKVLELDPNYAMAYFSKGVILSDYYTLTKKKQVLEDALYCYDKAIQIDPEDTDSITNKGLALQNENRLDEAIECFDKVMEIDPDNESAFSNKGNALLGLGKYQEASDCYDTALKMNPKLSDTMYMKSQALYLQDNAEDAHYWLEKALKIDPEIPDGAKVLHMLKDRIKFNQNIHNSSKKDVTDEQDFS